MDEHALQDGAEEHCADQQDRGQQGLLQGALAFFAGADQVDGRDQNHHQDRQEPQCRENAQGFLYRTVFQAVGQGAVADQVRDRAAQLEHQHCERQGCQQAGHGGDAAGDVAAQLPGDLRAGERIAPGRQEADQKQWPWCHLVDDAHCSALVPGVEQGDQAENDRG
ncbi:hypothetical protein D3C80_1467860 [compost metagenome]